MCDRAEIETLWRNRFTPYLNRVLNAEEDFFAKALRDGWDKTYAALILDAFRRLYPSDDPETVAVELRRLKRKAALLIGAADLNGDWGIEKVTRALSLLAETCLKTLYAAGFTPLQVREPNGNLFAALQKDTLRVNLFFAPCDGELRVTACENEQTPCLTPTACEGPAGTVFS